MNENIVSATAYEITPPDRPRRPLGFHRTGALPAVLLDGRRRFPYVPGLLGSGNGLHGNGGGLPLNGTFSREGTFSGGGTLGELRSGEFVPPCPMFAGAVLVGAGPATDPVAARPVVDRRGGDGRSGTGRGFGGPLDGGFAAHVLGHRTAALTGFACLPRDRACAVPSIVSAVSPRCVSA